MTTVIRAEDLGKRYLVGHRPRERYVALRDVLAEAARRLARRVTSPLRTHGAVHGGLGVEEFWALSGASFEVQRGERVGIIGRNGAGKTTLLKLLSRITEPTAGRIRIRGRVASLLEVGTGFHPELTGRENIFLNGAVLGMRRAEIIKSFDSIVDFSGVERFLDTPVKRYSSGMYVRLAFSVAAHLDPEILLVDEVLAVGDAEFQQKCLSKMDAASHEGRTVLFVSHNLQAVRRLCDSGILLDAGRIVCRGAVEECVAEYTRGRPQPLATVRMPSRLPSSGGSVRVESVTFLDGDGSPTSHYPLESPIQVSMELGMRPEAPPGIYLVALVKSSEEQVICSFSSVDQDRALMLRGAEGVQFVRVAFPNVLAPGRYSLELRVKSGQELLDRVMDVPFLVDEVSAKGKREVRQGVVHVESRWEVHDGPMCRPSGQSEA